MLIATSVETNPRRNRLEEKWSDLFYRISLSLCNFRLETTLERLIQKPVHHQRKRVNSRILAKDLKVEGKISDKTSYAYVEIDYPNPNITVPQRGVAFTP